MHVAHIGRRSPYRALECVILLFALLLAAGGCERSSSTASGGSSSHLLRVTTQYGLSYLPLTLMQDRHLIEQEAQAAGLGKVEVEWTTLNNGSAASDALLSGSADLVAAGVAAHLTLWDKTNGDVRALGAISNAPMYLNSLNPAVKTVKDFTAADRIALPASKVSAQAVVLQMAAAQAFGDADYAHLDKLTVSMKHPDGMAVMLGGRSEITAHMSSPPFQDEELKDPRVHRVLSSYDVLGGPHTHIDLCAMREFHDKNAPLCAAVLRAIEKADQQIKQDPHAAAEVYLRISKSGESLDDVMQQLSTSGLAYSPAPSKLGAFAGFMHRVGTIKSNPASWKDLFYPEVHEMAGS
jgi:NitT/TauT family transport system substrate-binding protein